MSRSSLVVLALAALLAGGAWPARAAITPEARAVADRYLEAIGGRAAWERDRSQYFHGTIAAFGLAGQVHGWSAAPDRRASRVEIGPFKIRDGFDGRTGWRVDQTGKVIRLDGKDLEDARAAAWFENERWLAADQGGGTVEHAGVEQDAQGSYDVLAVTPPAGRARRLLFDRSTGLLARVVQKTDAQTVTATPSDWRFVGDRRFAFRTLQQVEGAPMNTVSVTLDSIARDPDLAPSVFAMPSADAGEPRWLKTPGVARLPFDYETRHVWMRASVNGGPPADFLYDTGASVTVLDSAYAARIGVAREGSLQGQGAGSAGSGALGRVSSLRVEAPDGDGIEMPGLAVALLDLNSTLAPFFWREIAGVIGYDVITRFVNEIDYDTGTLTLHDPVGWSYQGPGGTLAMTIAGHLPVIPFKLDGEWAGEARLDVGSGATLDLHRPFWEKHGIDRRIAHTLEVTGGGFGGTFKSRMGRMKKLEIGPYKVEAPVVSLSGATTGALASEDFQGNIGNQLLERFKVTLDYERRQLHLEPSRRYGEPDRRSRLGAQLYRRGDAVMVANVLEGSAAERGKLRDGDEVRSIDGRPPLEMGHEAVERLFEDGEPGRRVELEIVRGGKTLRRTVRLRDML